MRVRLQEVAQQAAVSIQTVSRVIRAPHLVSPETAARVQQAMRELGYVKNEQATALRLGRPRTIGLLLPLLAIPFWSEVAAGAEARAHEQGYSLLLCDTSDLTTKEEQYLALLLGYPVAGTIYAHPRCRPATHPVCATLVQSEMPVVVISVEKNDLPYPHIRTDDERAGYVAIKHLLDLGRKHLALISNTHEASLERIRGASNALEEAGLSEEHVIVYKVPSSYAGGRAAGEALLAMQQNWPDGIFSTTDTIALGLIEALRSGGIRVPEDIAILSHDGLPATAFIVPSLTTIAPRAREMGAKCIDILLHEIHKEQREKKHFSTHFVEADLIVRASTLGMQHASLHGVSSAISDERAWEHWRTQMPLPSHKTEPVTVLSLHHFKQEIMSHTGTKEDEVC